MAKSGLTLLEIIIALAIVSIVAYIGTTAFSTFNRKEVLEKSSLKVAALLDEARSLSTTGRSDSQYGVHFTSSTVELFKGSTYSSTAVVDQVNIPGLLAHSTVLADGGSDIVFTKLDGGASTFGTTTLSLISNSLVSKTIIIYKTGLIERK